MIQSHGIVPQSRYNYGIQLPFQLEGRRKELGDKVLICRMWDSVSTKDNTLLIMDMVLSDEKGNLMHAAVRKHLMSRFKRLLTEGLVYTLRNIKVTTNIYPYRPLISNLRLLFLATTSVEALDEVEAVACIPKYGFQFVNQVALRSRADYVNTLSNIVGCLCGFGEIEVVGAGRRKKDFYRLIGRPYIPALCLIFSCFQ